MIKFLCQLKVLKQVFNNIETLISQALINMDISHDEFVTILKEKDKCEKMKSNLSSKNVSNDSRIRV